MNKKINKLKNFLESHLKNEEFLISAYIYGSILRDDYREDTSDVDILLIVKDNTNITKIRKKTTEVIASCKNIKLEFTVITEYEFYNGFHPGWTEYFFITLKRKSIFVCGKDILNEFNFEINFDSVLKKTIWLCQRLRNIIINITKQDEIEFWNRKYEKWIEIIISEILYLRGIYDPCPKKLLAKFKHIYPEINITNSAIDEKYTILTYLEKFLIDLKKNERIRNGIIVILHKQKNNKKYFLLLKSKDEWKGWEFIKGGIKTNETIEEAVRREVHEETGIKNIEIKKIFPFKIEIKMISDNRLEKRIYTPVVAEYYNGKITLEKKFKKAKIFDLEKVIKNLKWPTYKKMFFKIIEQFN